ncbi:uncharacterized protein AMSG_12201 [Thecamonas trahens ATCC 50062]|uniref:Sphingomyelin synthase-like domain-containing protein n=1 Tax=Thecamonas trahens ATCC 50062 TaxID=461836 RepID=A0A0L0DM23_THETB|nr:hypothetical protein AMSG_12201 [Thecamonas trahens ATCC 50062]KNC53315.1 hypothetical protein AMSG_12201 [Thecamonas trahens ATCC 50062]|eukprot:XP_013754600.1 hypothetical protein AMSG_12201 [Thecamonas trahens ATCC 50062]
MANILIWLYAQAPQLYRNYRNGGVEALSFKFLAAWVLGDVANLVGCIYTHQLPMQLYTAIYFCAMDTLMISQYAYYRIRAYNKDKAERDQDALESRSLIQDSPAFNPYSSSSHAASVAVMALVLGLTISTGALLPAAALPATSDLSSALEPADMVPGRILLAAAAPTNATAPVGKSCLIASSGSHIQYIIGIVVAWISGLLYFYARIPQILLNAKRKRTEGLSTIMFVSTFSANTCYALSVLLTGPDFKSSHFWAATSSFLVGTIGVLFESSIILFQMWIYRNNNAELFESINSVSDTSSVAGAISYKGRLYSSANPWPYSGHMFKSGISSRITTKIRESLKDGRSLSVKASVDMGVETVSSLRTAYLASDPYVLGSLRCYLMFLWTLAASYVMNICNELSDRSRPVVPVLDDVVFHMVDLVAFPVLADYLVGIHVALMLYITTCSSISTIVSRRFWTIYGCVNLIRSLTITLTQLPDPSPRCDFHPDSVERGNIWVRGLRMLFPLGVITCGDLIFSGHSCVIVMTSLFWIRYHRTIQVGPVAYLKRIAWRPFALALKYWIVVPTTLSLYYIVSTRLHYSVDVFIAVYVTIAAVVCYERFVRTPHLRARSRILLWLESYVDLDDHVILNQYAVRPNTAPLWPFWT